MKRLPYLNWTTAMLGVTYLLLRAVALKRSLEGRSFPDGWQFLDPFGLIAQGGHRELLSIGMQLLLTAGLILISAKRARDAGWRPWIGGLMLLPVVRLFVFVALAITPSAAHRHVLDVPGTSWLGRVSPRTKRGSAVAAVLIAVLLVIPLGFVSVEVLQTYGLALFIGLPFLLGSVSAYLYNRSEARSMRSSIGVAMTATSVALLLVFIMAMEGFVCLLMAAPIVYAIAAVGALIGRAVADDTCHSVRTMSMLVCTAPLLMAFETANAPEAPMFHVTTSIRVAAPPERVWEQLVTFSHMERPTELIFRAGISYPIEARIVGSGVGACRYCEFNTGPFVEPITTWDEPHLLAFDVQAFPPPMTELSIYEHINAPHIHGFFQSHHGQFRLKALPNGGTLLEGTTWYTHDIWPVWYWRLWSDGILHRIHLRVLTHIRAQSEH